MKQIKNRKSLTAWDLKTIRIQVRKNSQVIDVLIKRIDLLINKEKCPQDANILLFLRKRLQVAMAENDTFRRVLSKHALSEGETQETWLDPVAYLVGRIRERQRSSLLETHNS